MAGGQPGQQRRIGDRKPQAGGDAACHAAQRHLDIRRDAEDQADAEAADAGADEGSQTGAPGQDRLQREAAVGGDRP